MKRSTLVVLVIFLTLVGLLLYLNQNEPAEEETEIATAEPLEFLFSDSDGLPTSIDIKNDAGDQVVIFRNEAGLWALDQPIETEAPQGGEADQASAEAAASQLTTLRIESKPEVDPEAAGLDQPSYTLTVEMTGGTEKSVRIGDLTPTEIGYYASIDDSNEVLIINRTGLDALLTMIENPPIVEPTPTNIP
jgi:hypothetical protein